VGFVASNGIFLILGLALTPEDFAAWGWRLPFLGSALLVGVGLWVRLRLTETPAFARAAAAAPPPRVPLAEVFRSHARAVVAGTFAVVACYAIFYLSTAFALGYGTTALHYRRETFLGVQLGAILFMAAGIVAAGYLSDRYDPRGVLMGGCICTIPAGLLMGPLMGSGSLFLVFVFLSLALLLMGFVYGPLGAWLPGLFPARVRYTGASVAFNVGGILGGALSPVIAQALSQEGGLWPVGIYLSGAALVSFLALLSLPSSRHAVGD
jgi:MFS family permease